MQSLCKPSTKPSDPRSTHLVFKVDNANAILLSLTETTDDPSCQVQPCLRSDSHNANRATYHKQQPYMRRSHSLKLEGVSRALHQRPERSPWNPPTTRAPVRTRRYLKQGQQSAAQVHSHWPGAQGPARDQLPIPGRSTPKGRAEEQRATGTAQNHPPRSLRHETLRAMGRPRRFCWF